ncbi:oligosaccharide flippase family protein [Lutimonas saemankumensis]|uniref:lipopolysaccharide biosynthesis protein n=1 Tax=Lutimonas saemankumensis TaxID=483016 RepID=UPI001CD499AF|nr:oligosaccharide flippase family protein [Lutimonas saemankumensis]MCA0931059.1 oligosaccharide flippase family protein [Lutimonas saemankumensis]
MLYRKISNIFKGHERTVKARKNIFTSFAIKGMSIIVGFLLIRVTLNYLNQTEYGIWITLTSFISWFTFFEIGLGNGLKNKLAESLAKNDNKMARIYVSTTYAILSMVIGLIAVIFFFANFFIDWTIILNTGKELGPTLTNLALIVFGFFFMRFVLKLIGTILRADQRPAIAGAFGPIGNLIKLIVIYILTLYTEGSLLYLGWVLSIVPTLVLIFATVYFYNSDYKHIAPSINHIEFKYAKDLLNLGFKFFLIQISALVMFQSSNIIIAQYYGPEEVTPYNLAYKLFSMINMVFAIIVAPFWAAFTEAWVKMDLNWVKKTVRNLFYIWMGLVFISLFLYLISDTFFDVWLGTEKMKSINITDRLKISLIIYFLLFTFGSVFNMFINGVGKLQVQMYSLLIGATIFIPITIFFIKILHWGIESVVIASIVSNFYSPFVAPFHYYKLINNRAHGIWNK